MPKLPLLNRALQSTTGSLALLGLTFLGIATLTRLALGLATGLHAVPLEYWPGIFLRGLWFDLLTLSWAIVPLLLYRALLPAAVRRHRWHDGIRLAGFFFATFLLLFGAASEWTFWEEFSTRFNFIAVDYLIYTHEVIGNIVESYPLGWILAGLALAAGLITFGLRRRLLQSEEPVPSWRGRAAYVLLALALPMTGFELADVDDMAQSDNVYANELSGNGLMTFAAAFRRNELDYERFYRSLPQDQASEVLRRAGVPRTASPQTGDAQPLPFARRPKNVVLISVESLSARYLGRFGNAQGLTPNLDRLADQGLLFTQLYATGTRTVRGLEALSLGTPPIPGQAIVRRPGNEHLATLGEVLRQQGYETLFLYGGYGYFDNMNAYFAGNDYRVVDRTAIPKEAVVFENIWGVADEVLYDHALVELDQAHAAGKPFLAHLMTTSNHRPYTYPGGRINIPSPGGRDGAVKYTDYAIGHLIEAAKKKPWFADTLFVITADHCASAAGKTQLPVAGYHIPLVLYAPELIKPGRYERLVSQIDIAPTLIDLLGKAGGEHFFGQSVFRQGQDAPRAFISNYQELGYYKGDVLTVLGPKKRAEAFRIDPMTREASPTALDPKLLEEAVAYYQETSRAFKQGELKLAQKAK